MSPIATAPAAIIRDAATGNDFWSAAGESGGANDAVVWSDDTRARLVDLADDALSWASGDPALAHLADHVDALHQELLHLYRRAHKRALLHAKQFQRRARVYVALTREGDHLLALIAEQ